MVASSFYVPRVSSTCLLSLGMALYYQQVNMTQAPSILLLSWFSEHVRFCVQPLRIEYLFPVHLRLSLKQALLAFKARCSEALSSWFRTPWLGI